MQFCARYDYAGRKWGLIIDAANWADAEKRCRQLHLILDGELISERPAGKAENKRDEKVGLA